MRLKLLAGLAAVILIVLGIYGWGVGLFLPCGPVLKVIGSADCRVIASFPAIQTQMLEVLPDGTLLTALRGDGEAPAETQRLVQLDLDGRTISDVALPAIPNETSWGRTAVSADGSRLVFSSLHEPTTVLDRTTGAILGSIERYGVSHLGFDADGRVLLEMGIGSFERPTANTAELFELDGTKVGDVSGSDAAPIFAQGISAASSPDGKMLVQHMETRGNTGVVAVSIIEQEFADWAGPLMVAPLGSWRLGGHILPHLSFSPTGEYLAASFDSPDEWGQENSALIIWRVSDREVVARVPTWRAEWRDIVWLPDQPAVAAQRFNLDKRVSDIAVIRYRE